MKSKKPRRDVLVVVSLISCVLLSLTFGRLDVSSVDRSVLLSSDGMTSNMMRYEYYCSECKLKFEVRQGMLEPREADCPLCGEPADFIFCWNGSILFDFPSLDSNDIMNKEGKWNY